MIKQNLAQNSARKHPDMLKGTIVTLVVNKESSVNIFPQGSEAFTRTNSVNHILTVCSI